MRRAPGTCGQNATALPAWAARARDEMTRAPLSRGARVVLKAGLYLHLSALHSHGLPLQPQSAHLQLPAALAVRARATDAMSAKSNDFIIFLLLGFRSKTPSGTMSGRRRRVAVRLGAGERADARSEWRKSRSPAGPDERARVGKQAALARAVWRLFPETRHRPPGTRRPCRCSSRRRSISPRRASSSLRPSQPLPGEGSPTRRKEALRATVSCAQICPCCGRCQLRPVAQRARRNSRPVRTRIGRRIGRA